MTFDNDVMPERIWDSRMVDEPAPSYRKILSAGIATITQDNNGVELERPTKAIVIAIGQAGNAEEYVFSISPAMTRSLIRRLDEYACMLEVNKHRGVV